VSDCVTTPTNTGCQPLAQRCGGPVGGVEEEPEPGNPSQAHVRVAVAGELCELPTPLAQEGDGLRTSHQG
jgi:hypothetical protein